MSNKGDYSRIREMFYPSVCVPEENDVSLKAFIIHGLKTFNDMREKNKGRKIIYTGHDKRCSLSLYMTSIFNKSAELTEIEMRGRCYSLPPLLAKLKGNMDAEFSEFSTEDLEPDLRTDIGRYKNGNQSNLGQLAVYFAPTPYHQESIRKAELRNRKRSPKISARTLDNVLDADSINLLSSAARIISENFFYIDDDDSNDLIQESCIITQPQPGDYSWKYNMKTANGRELCSSVLEQLESWFELVKSTFSYPTYHQPKIVDILGG